MRGSVIARGICVVILKESSPLVPRLVGLALIAILCAVDLLVASIHYKPEQRFISARS